MGWAEFHRRREALDGVVETAVEGGELVVPDPFGDVDELLLALHHRWSLRLAGRVELASLADDPVDAVAAAWRAAEADNRALRGLLDRHADRPVLRGVTLAEQRMLATAADLTGPGDGPDEQAALGAAFLALVRSRPARRHNPVERLLRRLSPAS